MSWLPPVVTVAPASEPITIQAGKAQCRTETPDDESYIHELISAARARVEQHCSTKLVTQTVVLRCSSWSDLQNLNVAPVQSVTGIEYLDPMGAAQTLSTDIYEAVLVGLEPAIRLKVNQSWPSIRSASDAIRVTVVAGYATQEPDIVHAIKLQVGTWFDSRSVGELSDGTKTLLTNHRRF